MQCIHPEAHEKLRHPRSIDMPDQYAMQDPTTRFPAPVREEAVDSKEGVRLSPEQIRASDVRSRLHLPEKARTLS